MRIKISELKSLIHQTIGIYKHHGTIIESSIKYDRRDPAPDSFPGMDLPAWSNIDEMAATVIRDGNLHRIVVVDPARLEAFVNQINPLTKPDSFSPDWLTELAAAVISTAAMVVLKQHNEDCLGAMEIVNSASRDLNGRRAVWGQDLYELAASYADYAVSAPIMSDRDYVSKAASRRWEKQTTGPWQGRGRELDIDILPDYPKTPDTYDDCNVADRFESKLKVDPEAFPWHTRVWYGGDAAIFNSMFANWSKVEAAWTVLEKILNKTTVVRFGDGEITGFGNSNMSLEEAVKAASSRLFHKEFK